MRRHKPWLLLLALVLVATGCSRLTFIRPKMERKDGEQIAPTYQVSDSAETKRRMEVERALALATQRLQAGDLDVAERGARAAMKADSQSADAQTILAVVAEQRGQAKAAGEHYRRATELAPGRGAEQNNYGAWLCSNGYPAESLVWFDRALQDSEYETPAAVLANAGGCADKAGQRERAERDLRQALALDPRNAFGLLSMAEHEYRAGRYFEARAFVERRLAAAPASADVLKLASQIEERLGDRTAAGRYVQQLRAEFPDASDAQTGGKAEQ
ncbi:type IV pilus biogenesis/stability protein PilW [Pseudoxanthomonas sp. PXM05]|uniref:type IV pilus biogenesis/stability protein PilW n=1 Tax=Pseudoxanthomonas sp. PXM05 TaxID=2854775 RepID=UPI0017980DA1|nr:type IV pilus biogenesis/stability protein PilW [Pseudoxanthomonas sp. PXM05]MBB3274465.1 type IV pilus assembly protein PilF [Pseudoxanthomonas sp. OG2]MBV7474971.1 type IV pilus biogenesis/stability protein PilW [Pseudoxanthomonas sp. PXM05]